MPRLTLGSRKWTGSELRMRVGHVQHARIAETADVVELVAVGCARGHARHGTPATPPR